jgi:hypothetical protein
MNGILNQTPRELYRNLNLIVYSILIEYIKALPGAGKSMGSDGFFRKPGSIWYSYFG